MTVLETELPVQSETSPEHILDKNISKICFFNDLIKAEKLGAEFVQNRAARIFRVLGN